MSIVEYSEHDIQRMLEGCLEDAGLTVRGEKTKEKSRWDVAVFAPQKSLTIPVIVVEVKNENASLAAAIKRENELKRAEQGRRYQREAKQCGGLYRIQPCVNEIMRYVWRRRILSVLGIGCWI